MPTSTPRIAADRLYSIAIRPQELAIFGEKVTFAIRYSPIFDDAGERATRHFKLLILEITTDVPADEASGRTAQRLNLLKCGWEIELETDDVQVVGSLPELDTEVPLLLGRIADTVNELARRARLEAPLGPSLIAGLIEDYRKS